MNLIDPILVHAKSRPNHPAIITLRDSISWSQLDQLIWSTALRLAEYGLISGDRVGIMVFHPVVHLITSLALAKMGVAHIAIAASESDMGKKHLLDQLELKCIFSDSEKIVTSIPSVILLKKLITRNVDQDQKQKLRSTDDQLAWLVLQSSGTTGAPKFAELNHCDAHDRFIRFLTLFNCSQDDIFWAASRPEFLVAKQRLTFTLLAGATVYLPLINAISLDLVTSLNQHKITLACGTPSHLQKLIAVGEPMPSIRAFEARSAFITEKLRLEFKSKITNNLYIVYGTNEGEALSLANPSLQTLVPNTVGFPTTSIRIEVVGEDHIPLPHLITGEIRAQGPGIISHYLRSPESSSMAFKNGWFYPGDLGYFTEDGALVLQGRKDDMMIYDGVNIYPAEIENVLSSHPAIEEVAAFPLKHEIFQDIPVAAVMLRESASETDLIEYCKVRLGIKHPRRIFFLNEFPRNQMGKILKRELSAIVLGK
jgi:acyl-coenzyme A synthetase/AMP-(fatty) acid ligase